MVFPDKIQQEHWTQLLQALSCKVYVVHLPAKRPLDGYGYVKVHITELQ